MAGDNDVPYAVQLEEIRGNIKLILSNQDRDNREVVKVADRVHGHANRFQLIEGRLNAIDGKFNLIDGERRGVASAFRVMYILWGVLGGGSVVAGLLLFVLKAKGL